MAMKHRSSDLCRNQVEPGLKSRQQRSNFFKGHRFPNRKSETEIVKKSAAVPKSSVPRFLDLESVAASRTKAAQA